MARVLVKGGPAPRRTAGRRRYQMAHRAPWRIRSRYIGLKDRGDKWDSGGTEEYDRVGAGARAEDRFTSPWLLSSSGFEYHAET